MPGRRARYPSEFRRQMVELVRAGRGPEELSREFEPSAQAIRDWVAQADRDEGRRPDGLTSCEREELRRLTPDKPTVRISLATRLRPTRTPSATNSAWMRGTP